MAAAAGQGMGTDNDDNSTRAAIKIKNKKSYAAGGVQLEEQITRNVYTLRSTATGVRRHIEYLLLIRLMNIRKGGTKIGWDHRTTARATGPASGPAPFFCQKGCHGNGAAKLQRHVATGTADEPCLSGSHLSKRHAVEGRERE